MNYTITAPAANWSGKTMTIEMSEDRKSFTVDLLKGYWFRLNQTSCDHDGETYEILWGDSRATPRQTLCRVHRLDFGSGVEWFAEECGVSRTVHGGEIEKGITVAAQMAVNLI